MFEHHKVHQDKENHHQIPKSSITTPSSRAGETKMNFQLAAQRMTQPVLNGKYALLNRLGEGNTSKVYLAQTLDHTQQLVAIKIIKDEFLQKDSAGARKAVLAEVSTLQALKQHSNIIKLLDYGDNGQVYKPTSGRTVDGLVFIVLEYVAGGLLLFDLCQNIGGAAGFGEDCGRYLFLQLLDALEHMHSRNVAHRDIKLENVLVDASDMTLKVADFGYASKTEEGKLLKSYRGTFTYMAPEIKEGRSYSGQKADLFSAGVVLFIMVRGIFPFKEARKEEYFYNLLASGNFQEYWAKVESQHLSADFRDLI